MTHCFVYVITECGADPSHKVGIAMNPDARLDQLQTGNPRKLILHHQYPCETRALAELCEKLAHEKLAKFRVKGEWFKCALDHARRYTCHYWLLTGAFEAFPDWMPSGQN